MAVSITLINKNTDSFENWVDRTNETINAVVQVCMTANGDANGSYVTGNSFLFGILGSNTITVYTGLRGGNVQSGALLPIVSNVEIQTENGGDQLSVGNSTVNTVVNSSSYYVANSTISALLDVSGFATGNVVANQTSFFVGDGSTNTHITDTGVLIGGFVSANQTMIRVGTTAANISVNSTAFVLGSNIVANSTGVWTTGRVNAATFTTTGSVNAATGYFTGLANASTFTTTGNVNAGSTYVTGGTYPTSNASGQSLGDTTHRWNLTGNTISVSGTVTATGNVTTSGNVNAVAGNFSGTVTADGFAGGSGLSLNSTSISVGTSPNVTINTTAVAVGANVLANNTWIRVGTTAANASVSNGSIKVGANVGANLTHLFVTPSFVVNGTQWTIGSNVYANLNSLTILGTASNVVINAYAVSIAGSNTITADTRSAAQEGGTYKGARNLFNFIAGNNVFLEVSEDVGGNRINVQINAVATSGSAIIGGTNTNIQFNDGDNFRGTNGCTFDQTTNNAFIGNTVVVGGGLQFTTATPVYQQAIAAAYVTSTGPDEIDSFTLGSYRTSEYVYSIKNDTANAYQAGRLLLLNDGTGGHIEEYGVTYSNASLGLLGAFSTGANDTHILLQFTPSSSLSYTIKGLRTGIPT